MEPILFGAVKDGKLLHSDKSLLKSHIESLEGMDVDLIIRKHKKDRSNNQNRYMWGVVYKLISNETGYTNDEAHDAMRMMFLLNNDGAIPTLKSTTDLTTVEMEAYLESIRQWAAKELNCSIPLPNEVSIGGD